MANYHLVILKKSYLQALLTGQKRIESRFTRTRREPFGQVLPGDRLLLKVSSGPVCAVATVAAVKIFENLAPAKIMEIKQRYNHYIRGSDKYWRSKADCRFGFLVQLKDVERIEPVRIHKKDWRAWVILTEKENFGLLKCGAIKKITPGKTGG
ncbi:MAG: ASCH domain-containing protein [Sedimentisphaerales bacterium]